MLWVLFWTQGILLAASSEDVLAAVEKLAERVAKVAERDAEILRKSDKIIDEMRAIQIRIRHNS